MKDINRLLNRIEKTRAYMMQTALEKGFQDKEVISLSQELDQLLNEYDDKKAR